MITCPVCNAPAPMVSEERDVRVGARSARVRDEFHRCEACGEELYESGQLTETQRRASAAIRKELGLLQPEEIRKIRESFSLTQEKFERLLGVGPKTVVRWERGTVFQNPATDTLLRLIREIPEASRTLARERGVRLTPKKAR